jgi:DNA-binding response OmpR family regulator
MIENDETNKSVFIVVADGAAREALMLAYGEAGFEVATASTMTAARALLDRPYLAVISDAELPDGEGVELLARASHLPV